MKEKKYYKRLRELREDNDYTQETIGKLLGISQRGYAHYENGDYDIMGEFLIKLSNFYNTSTFGLIRYLLSTSISLPVSASVRM